jgi:hypothetical protein
MTGRELEILTHGEAPWQRADKNRLPGTSTSIELPWIEAYFREADAADRSEEMPLDSQALAEFLAGARERRVEPGYPDDAEALRRRLAEMRARTGSGA